MVSSAHEFLLYSVVPLLDPGWFCSFPLPVWLCFPVAL
uniref:Uncharacterized protein n=1 Tax=Trichinella nativa TaxID=6335 RepID=A0A0V1K4N9_9BILA